MLPRLLVECMPSSFHLRHHHSILANQTKMPKQFCFSKMHHTLQNAICLRLVIKQSQQSHLVTFLKVISMFVTKGSNSLYLCICPVLLGCEIKPSLRHWAIAMHYPHPNPQSQVFNWLYLNFNYLPCHLNSSSQRWMQETYHLTSWLQSLKEKQINKSKTVPTDLHTKSSTFQPKSHFCQTLWKHLQIQFKVMRSSYELCVWWTTIWPYSLLSYLQQRMNIVCLTYLS